MRKINIIIAGLACALVFTFVLSGFRTEAAAAADKTPALGGWTLADGNTPAIQTAEPIGKGMTGGWAVRGSGKPGMFSDQNAQASFDAINKGDVMYNHVALLATQVVFGTNYKALCKGNDSNLYVVTWYRDLQGNASFTSAECVNIGAYSGL